MVDEIYEIYRFILEDHWELEQHDLILFFREPGIDTAEPAVIYLHPLIRKNNEG